MTAIGFLHTARTHVAMFGRLVDELAPEHATRHVVDESLLAAGRTAGLTPELAARVRARLGELVSEGAGLVVCTCSTIGAVAEELAAAIGVPVLRADRPMAEAAVAAGERIGVVVATESTVEPTLRLIRESAVRAGRTVTPRLAHAYSAWPHFESGDLERYHAEIARHARDLVPHADVLVLAQASMAPAANLIEGTTVLTSPRAAVTAAAALLNRD